MYNSYTTTANLHKSKMAVRVETIKVYHDRMSWLILAECIVSCFIGMYVRIWCMYVCISERIQCA